MFALKVLWCGIYQVFIVYDNLDVVSEHLLNKCKLFLQEGSETQCSSALLCQL